MTIVLIKAAQLILSLAILITLHELGHFIAARLFKTRVEKFYLFFNPWFSIFKFKRGETEYGLGWIPLGGYVKIAGMIDESLDKEQMKLPAQPFEFRSKPAWQRLIIMLGGIIVNVILGILIYSFVLLGYGEQYIPVNGLKYGIAVDSLGQEIGLRSGDKIISVDHKNVERFNQLPLAIVINQAKSIQVERDGKKQDVIVPKGVLEKMIAAKGAFIDIRVPFVVDNMPDTSVALKAGMRKGDQVIAINESPVEFFDEGRTIIKQNPGKAVSIRALRGNDTVSFEMVVSKSGFIGVVPVQADKYLKVESINYNLISCWSAGAGKAWMTLVNYVKQFGLVFNSEAKGYKHIGGFISIGSAFSPTWDWFSFWSFTAFLSIVLAFMNLLPIPALDGGHVLFTLWEMITRRKPSIKFLEYAQIGGMIIILSLLLFANGNDILKLFR